MATSEFESKSSMFEFTTYKEMCLVHEQAKKNGTKIQTFTFNEHPLTRFALSKLTGKFPALSESTWKSLSQDQKETVTDEDNFFHSYPQKFIDHDRDGKRENINKILAELERWKNRLSDENALLGKVMSVMKAL